MEGGQETEVNVPTSETPTREGLLVRLSRALSKRYELATFAALSGLDLSREIMTGDPMFTKSPPVEGADKLQHLGGTWDAYTTCLLTYYGLSLLTYPIREKIAPQVKVAIAFLAGNAAVIAVETGKLGVSGKHVSELADIPSGVAGSIIFAGVMLLNRGFINACSERIKSLIST